MFELITDKQNEQFFKSSIKTSNLNILFRYCKGNILILSQFAYGAVHIIMYLNLLQKILTHPHFSPINNTILF